MASTLADHSAPKHLPGKLQAEWKKTYKEEKDAVLRADPDNPNAARVKALHAANKLLRVKKPTSAADIEKMEPHEFVKREEREIDGVPHLWVLTADGDKIAFPKETKK
ncbi:hypothetical protein [Terriglobus sp. RCC_193]|uniref:hypothetical protein n=1 Tax=Terriglobus sp. RCC_193 TaxID=3239218 RepID=UPI0035255A61